MEDISAIEILFQLVSALLISVTRLVRELYIQFKIYQKNYKDYIKNVLTLAVITLPL